MIPEGKTQAGRVGRLGRYGSVADSSGGRVHTAVVSTPVGSARDVTTGDVVASPLEYATNAWTRFRGLMMRRELPAGAGLLIRPCSSIHMMFMRFPIDAVFIDDSGRVTKVARGVRPWVGMAFGGRGAKTVIELPLGGAGRVAVGDQLAVD